MTHEFNGGHYELKGLSEARARIAEEEERKDREARERGERQRIEDERQGEKKMSRMVGMLRKRSRENPNLNKNPLIDTDGFKHGHVERERFHGGAHQSILEVDCIEVLFDGIEQRILTQIARYEAVFGVVAWLTNDRILRALREKYVSIVVQKEDFLRPHTAEPDWHGTIRELYDAIPTRVTRYDDVPGPLKNMSSMGDSQVEAIRCAGVRSRGRNTGARFHHKFAVFADVLPRGENEWYGGYRPRAVVTGSYNWTWNARKSRENVVVIHDERVARAYWQEWSNVCAISEPLDWESEYIEPEWRIGT